MRNIRIDGTLIPNVGVDSDEVIVASDVARICLECPLPGNKCKSGTCKRFNEELAKLKQRGNKDAKRNTQR